MNTFNIPNDSFKKREDPWKADRLLKLLELFLILVNVVQKLLSF